MGTATSNSSNASKNKNGNNGNHNGNKNDDDLLPDYRTIDGTDNNLQTDWYNPFAGSEEIRFTDPYYAPGTTDGMITGPDPRAISNLLSGGARAEVSDTVSGISGYSYVFGQFVDHDLDRTNDGGDDISMTLYGDPTAPDGTVISMTRFETADGKAINAVNGWLDASQIYGSDYDMSGSLRYSDGHMKTSDGNNLPIDEDGNFYAGDIRVMENPDLSAITLLFVREHNFQVDRLQAQHPDWSGDQIYEQARAITTAEYQNIVYNEFLPAIIGQAALKPYTGYNPTVDPRIMEEFAHAAFRFGHSTVSNEQEKLDENGNVLENQSLADASQNDVAAREANGGLDALLRGPASDGANMVDTGAVDGLRNTMTGPDTLFDLIAVDIQRQRDLGINTFNNTREALGLARIGSFEQLTSDASVVADLHTIYDPWGGIDALDLFMGGLAENHAPGSTMGETFSVIIGQQFAALRDGDRFYWENQPFDPETKAMIGNTTLSDLIIRDTDTDNIQQQAFVETTRHSSDVESENPDGPQLVIGIDADGALIKGGPANDTLVAGWGNCQTLTGDGGSDLFVINSSGHTLTISDFNTTFDTIQFQGDASGCETAEIRSICSGSQLTFNGNVVTLAGVSADQVSANNLTFLDNNAIVTNHGLALV